MTKKVLVVDDSQTVRDHVAQALSSSDVEVIGAEDGLDAIEKLAIHSDVALIFCDVNMPRMNGIEMISEVRRMEKFADLPIVMLTTEGRPDLIRRAKEAGAKAWIIKPFKQEHLFSVLQKLTA